jgi:hypothetical protein
VGIKVALISTRGSTRDVIASFCQLEMMPAMALGRALMALGVLVGKGYIKDIAWSSEYLSRRNYSLDFFSIVIVSFFSMRMLRENI